MTVNCWFTSKSHAWDKESELSDFLSGDVPLGSPPAGRRGESYLNVPIYVEGSGGSWTLNSSATQQLRLASELTNFPTSHRRGGVDKRADSRNYAPARGRLNTGCYPRAPPDHDTKTFSTRNLRQLIEEEAQPFVIFQISTFYHNEKVFLALDGARKEETLFCYQRASFFIVMKWLFILSSDFFLYTVEFVVSGVGSMKSSLINASSVCAGSVSGWKLDYLSNRVFK